MTQLAISGWQPFPDYTYPGDTATLRIFYSQTFIASDGQQVIGDPTRTGGFYLPVPCTVVNGVLNIPTFSLTTTDDTLTQNNPLATAVIYDQDQTPREEVFSGFTIPNRLAPSTDIGTLTTANQTIAISNPVRQYLDRDQVIALIRQMQSPKGSNTVFGGWRSKIAPISALDPVLCADNDTRVTSFVTPFQYGAVGNGTGATITSADVTAHGLGTDYPWVGTYVVGTDTKDYVGLQEAIYAAFYNGTLTPNGIANVHLNKVLYIPPGAFYINRRLNIRLLLGGRIMGAGRFVTQILSTTAGQQCIRTNGMGYSHVEGIHFDTNANQVGNSLFELDWDNSSGGGALQSNTFFDCMFDGQHATTVDYGLRIGNTGFMGSENLILNCYFNTFKTAAWGTFNFNALQNTMIGGNIQGCPLYGAWCRQGSIFMYSVGSQNGIKDQIDVSGADLKISNSSDTHSAMMDCRSESAVMVQSSNGHRVRLHNNSMRTDVTVWSAAQNYTVGQLITGTTSAGDGKLYIVVGAGTSGTGEPAWPLITPANSKFTVTGAMILATPTLTAPSGFFPAGIAGQTAIVPGAAFGGGDLTSVIFSRDSGTQLTLTDNALTTVSNKVIHWGTPFTATGGTATMIPYDFAQASVDNAELIGNTFKLGYLDIGGNSDTLNPNTVRGNSFSRQDWSQNLSGGVFLQGAVPDFGSNVVHRGGGRNTGQTTLSPYGQSVVSGVSKVFAGALSQINIGQQAWICDAGISAVATPSQGFFRAVVDLVDARNMLSILYKLGGLPATGANSNTTAYPAPFDTTDVYISGGLSTGNVSGGTVHIQVAQAGSAGSSLNTPTDMLAVKPTGLLVGSVAFADLSTASNALMVYCSDGTAGSSPLTGGGGGCFAIRQGGAWKGL